MILIHESSIRGHRVYKDIWTPMMGEILEVRREPENEHDHRAVCLLKSSTIIGQIVFMIVVDNSQLELPSVAFTLSVSRSILVKDRSTSNSYCSHRENIHSFSPDCWICVEHDLNLRLNHTC